MPPLDVVGTTPVLVVGTGEVVRGDLWLSNPSGADVKLTGAIITVTLPTGPRPGPSRCRPTWSSPPAACGG